MNNTALIGNPNTGKTSLFNALTSSYQYVGNWSGVTVEKKVGQLRNKAGSITDLPGVYSLNPVSRDEGVVATFLVGQEPSAIVNIVDASQLERNLYLTLQMLEYGKPLLIGLNMMDVAESRGVHIQIEVLSRMLGVPVIPLVARTGKGCHELLEVMTHNSSQTAAPDWILDYGETIEQAILDISRELAKFVPNPSLSTRWAALQLLENNQAVRHALKLDDDCSRRLDTLLEGTERSLAATHPSMTLTHYLRSVRMARIQEILKSAVITQPKAHPTLTDRIDQMAMHPFWGVPLFLTFMYVTFKLTFDWLGNPLSDMLDTFISGPLSTFISGALEALNVSGFTAALILDGIVAGVGGVLVFIPQIFILFLIISFIEDTGYMARITVMLDRLMEMVGLNGKSLIPFIIGFGCNVPAIMASRGIEQEKERTLTMLLVPLMSCSARLPVYALFAGVFFARSQALVVFSLYFLGILLTLLLAKLFSRTIFKNQKSFYFMELPPYRLPQGRTLFRSTWEKGKGFLRKAGTFILAGSVLIWMMSYLGPGGVAESMDDSFLAYVGGLIAPLLQPVGFGTWQAGAALMTGFMAKEVVVSTMNIIYHAPDINGLQVQISSAFTPLQAYSFMSFILLYTPCLATVGVLRKETSSWKWTAFSVAYAVLLAYLVSIVIYQGGKLIF
ncbi:ferrous iron transport protein B [Paenibacillus apis]|uniref:Ferrous iron transport protein B n=1 Tax=Paenibacillus apis TaxID=1792174 RepID=A0A919Y217_9BACL|nr:ferrous iron transport protein B [Paenibacillus apis]GIO42676.1 ferrous iron transport protein B [Paenibacillus apis]